MLGKQPGEPVLQFTPLRSACPQSKYPVEWHWSILSHCLESQPGLVELAPGNPCRKRAILLRDQEIDDIRQLGGIVEFHIRAILGEIADNAFYGRLALIITDNTAIDDTAACALTTFDHGSLPT